VSRFGPQFPCMTDAYDRTLRLAAWRVGRQLGFDGLMRDGVSLTVCGPNFETPAELRMMRALGADVVGECSIPAYFTVCFSIRLYTMKMSEYKQL